MLRVTISVQGKNVNHAPNIYVQNSDLYLRREFHWSKESYKLFVLYIYIYTAFYRPLFKHLSTFSLVSDLRTRFYASEAHVWLRLVVTGEGHTCTGFVVTSSHISKGALWRDRPANSKWTLLAPQNNYTKRKTKSLPFFPHPHPPNHQKNYALNGKKAKVPT